MAATVPVFLALLTLCHWASLANAQPYAATSLTDAHATFYGGQDASGTMFGACGYTNLYSQGYGTNTAALSGVLFNDGLTCGACFQLTCKVAETTWCYGTNSIVVTATNLCPQGSFGGWCDSPKSHFDLSYPAFIQLARAEGGVIPVSYMRVPCNKQGGVRFTLGGNAWYNNILVHNVGGAGDVQSLSISGANSVFGTMNHGWGQVWTGGYQLVNQPLSFRVTVGDASYVKTMDFWNVAPSNWGFGQTYEVPDNFSW